MGLKPEFDDAIRRVWLEPKIDQWIREMGQTMREANWDPDTIMVIAHIWKALTEGRDSVVASGVDAEKLGRDFVIIREILDERRQEALFGDDGELARTMGPIFDQAVLQQLKEQTQRDVRLSQVQAIDDAIERIISNVDAMKPFTDFSETDIEARKAFLRSYASSLRQKAIMH